MAWVDNYMKTSFFFKSGLLLSRQTRLKMDIIDIYKMMYGANNHGPIHQKMDYSHTLLVGL